MNQTDFLIWMAKSTHQKKKNKQIKTKTNKKKEGVDWKKKVNPLNVRAL